MASSESSGLKAIIVGAGIAGLASSIALSKAGIKVTILERSTFKNEIGAAITITPNGSKILDRWGFDSKRAAAVEGQRMHVANGTTLDLIHEEPFEHWQPLWALAESLGVTIELGSSVEDINENRTVRIKGKEEVRADLIVLADGVHSQHLPKVTGKAEPLIRFGLSSIRALVPYENVRTDPKTAPFFKQQTPTFYMPVALPPRMSQMVTYPCRNKEILNISLVHKTLPGYEDREDWHSPIPLDDALKTVEGVHPACQEVLSKAESHKIYIIAVREILRRYVNGRIVVVGDAAHVMPPTHAQGAVTCLDEACALGVFFRGLQDPAEVPGRLQLYEELVMPRMQTVQLLSQSHPGQNNRYRKEAEAIWEGGKRGKVYPDAATYLSPAICDFFFTYDMQVEAEKAMKEAGLSG